MNNNFENDDFAYGFVNDLAFDEIDLWDTSCDPIEDLKYLFNECVCIPMDDFHLDRSRYLQPQESPVPWRMNDVVDEDDDGFVDTYDIPPPVFNDLPTYIKSLLSLPKINDFMHELEWHPACLRMCDINHTRVYISEDDWLGCTFVEAYKNIQYSAQAIGTSLAWFCNSRCINNFHTLECKRMCHSQAITLRAAIDTLRHDMGVNASVDMCDLFRTVCRFFSNDSLLRMFLLKLCGDVELNPGPDYKDLCKKNFIKRIKSDFIEESRNNFKFNLDKPLPVNTKFNRRKIRKNISVNFQGISDYVKSFNSDVITDACVGSIPYIGTSAVVSRHVNKLGSKISNSLDLVNSMLESVNNMFKGFSDTVGKCDWFDSLRRLFMSLINVYFAKPGKKIVSFIFNLTNFAIDCGLSISHFRPILNLFTSDDGYTLSFQSGFDYADIFAKSQIAASGLIVILFSLSYKVLGKVFDVTKAIAFLGKLGKDLSGVTTLGKMLSATSENVMSWFKGDVLGLDEATELRSVVANISLWFDEVRSLLSRMNEKTAADRLLEDPDMLLYIENLYKRGLEFSIEISNKRLSEKVRFPFEQHMKLLTEIFKKCETSGAFGNKPRISPLVVWLFGSSGVGKSGVTWPLAIDLNNIVLGSAPEKEKMNFTKHVYFRNVEQEFWDGYQGQNIVVYDDFGQLKDAQGTPNVEFFEIIRTANIAPYPLHMAHLEEKRKAKFISKVAILTSNESVLNIQSLTHPDAVNRRIDIKAEVCVLPQFAKTVQSSVAGQMVTRLDVNKVKEAFGDKVAIATQVYCFKIINSDSNVYTGEILNYKEFSELCKSKLCERVGNSHDLNKYLELYALGKHPDIEIPCPSLSEINKPKSEILDSSINQFLEAAKAHGVDVNFQGSELDEEIFFDCDTNIDNNFKYIKITSPSVMCECSAIYTIDGENISSELSAQRMLEFKSFDELFNDIISRYPLGIYKRVRYSNMLSATLLESKKSFLDSAYECVNSMWETIKSNPMITVLSIVGAVVAGFTLLGGWNWLFSEEDEDNEFDADNINKKPIDLNNTFFVKDFSKEFDKIKVCKEDNIYVSRVDKNELELIKQLKSKHFHIGKVKLEGNVSGDVTTKKSVIKVEGNASGDVTTVKPKVVVEANHSGDVITRNKPTVRYEGQDIDVELQMWKDQTAQTLIGNRILPNLYRMIGMKGERECELMNCLFIRGSIALVPTHIKAGFAFYDTIVFENSFKVRYVVNVSDINFIQITDVTGRAKEASLIYVKSKYIHCHADIVKHFTTSYEMGKWHAADVALPTIRYNKNLDMFLPFVLGNSEAIALDNSVNLTDSKQPDGYQRMALREGMRYRLNTKAGDCGTPVIVNENKVLRKIAGIHVAASSDGNCFAESITQKDLERALASVEVEYQIKLDVDMLNHKLHNIPLDEEFPTVINNLVPSFKFNPLGICVDAPADATKTELRPSCISGTCCEPTTRPAFLKPVEIDGKIVDIKCKNLTKAAMDTPFIPPREVMTAIIPVKEKLLANVRPELQRILTYEEGIVGSELSFYCEPINRSSSPGYPWINDRKQGSKGKQQWFGSDDYILDLDVKRKVEERIRLAKLGLRVPTIWVDTLKDERRPIEKVMAGKTRVFANGPMDFTIAFRMYFLTFMAHVMENRILNEQSIGTNTWSPDWTRTAKYLSRKRKNGVNPVIAGDFSTFDGTLNSCIVGEFVNVINEFYNDGPENAMVRQVLFLEVFNSIHLCKDVFYMWTHSQPSGCPITTVLNSFYNSVSMRIVYNRLSVKTPYWNKFDEYCTMVSYGDDNVINISPDIIDWFNQVSISKGYETIGMIYTDEGKTGDIVEYRTLSQVAYLKRSFYEDRSVGVYKAPLDLDVILEMTNWVRGDLDIKFSTLENCSNAIRELSQHPRNIFDRYVPIINAACLKECKALPPQLSYDGYWEECLNKYYS